MRIRPAPRLACRVRFQARLGPSCNSRRMVKLRCVRKELLFGLVVLNHLSKDVTFPANPKTLQGGSMSGSHSFALHLQTPLLTLDLPTHCARMRKMYLTARLIEALRQKAFHQGAPGLTFEMCCRRVGQRPDGRTWSCLRGSGSRQWSNHTMSQTHNWRCLGLPDKPATATKPPSQALRLGTNR